MKDEFWASLDEEIKKRLVMKVPSLNGNSTSFYSDQVVGLHTINPETGAVTVQAPHWLMDDIAEYFERIKSQYNTIMNFEGKLLMVSTTEEQSEGLDIEAFASFADGKYQLGISNNVLGGITIADGAIQASQSGLNSLMGVKKIDGSNPLEMFIGWLESHGKVSQIQSPKISTTSGIPGEFSRFTRRYYNLVKQNAAAGDNGAAVATDNELRSVKIGTLLRVNPRYDIETGLVRTQLSLNQSLLNGNQTESQVLTTSDGSIETVNIDIPLVTEIKIAGETLLRDGDLIIVGGQTERLGDEREGGITGYKDAGWFSGILGNTYRSNQVNKYYFVMSVSVKRGRLL